MWLCKHQIFSGKGGVSVNQTQYQLVGNGTTEIQVLIQILESNRDMRMIPLYIMQNIVTCNVAPQLPSKMECFQMLMTDDYH